MDNNDNRALSSADHQLASGLVIGSVVGVIGGIALAKAGLVGIIVVGGIVGLSALVLRDMFRAADQSRF